MNHFIWILDANGNQFCQMASMVVAFQRHQVGTVIFLNNGGQVISQTAPEDVENRLNTYYTQVLLTLHKGGRP